MSEIEFEVDDRVIAIAPVDGKILNNRTGTIIEIDRSRVRTPIGVEFDEPFVDGHSCGHSGREGYCRWGEPDSFQLIDSQDDILIEDSPELLSFISSFTKRGDIDGV